MFVSRWKYRIFLTLASFPLAVGTTGGISEVYGEFRSPLGPQDMAFDEFFVFLGTAVLTLILFPILGFTIGRKLDLLKQK